MAHPSQLTRAIYAPVIALARLSASTRTDIPRIVDRLKELIKYKDFQGILRRVRRDGTTQRS